MIPQQTFESYPVFGDNATKVKPDDVKYAAGFQQADVLPAEWMNWAWAKNSKGITDANAGLSSIEEEIINVLTSRGKTPSASDNTQLLTVLNMIKAEAALAAHPVGSLYWTSSTENPATTFGGGTWTRIKDRFILAAGDTYANGNTGGAATVTLTADQIPSHNHSFTPAGSVSVTTNPTFTGSSHSHSYTPAGSVSVTTQPTFTGSAVNTDSKGSHSHTTNSQSTSSARTSTKIYNSSNTEITNTGGMSANESHSHTLYFAKKGGSGNAGDGGVITDSSASASNVGLMNSTYNYTNSKSLAHTHNMQHNHTVDISHTHGTDSQGAHTHSVTAKGTLSGGAYKFTGTAATLTATQGGTISGGAYSFTGTAGTTGSKGGGGAHNNMPPYIVKYCWERTA